MAYIGKTPITGNFVKLDAISVVNGQAGYTMNNGGSAFTDYENVNQFLVSLNGILQAPTTSFTVSGSTLTFASNLATGDVIDFVMVLGNTLDIGTPSDATVTQAKTNFVSTSSSAGLQIKGDGTTDGTLQLNCSQNSHGIKLKSPAHSAGASYTLTFPNDDGSSGEALTTNGSGVLSWASAGGVNTPCFKAVRTSNQSFTSGTYTKVQCNVETFDVGSAYDHSTNYRFTPSAGKYLIGGGTHAFGGNTVVSSFRTLIYKNGSAIYPDQMITGFGNSGNEQGGNTSVLDIANGSDYYELYCLLTGGSGNFYNSAFWGFKIIE